MHGAVTTVIDPRALGKTFKFNLGNDVTLQREDGRTVRTNKLLLSCRSRLLRRNVKLGSTGISKRKSPSLRRAAILEATGKRLSSCSLGTGYIKTKN